MSHIRNFKFSSSHILKSKKIQEKLSLIDIIQLNMCKTLFQHVINVKDIIKEIFCLFFFVLSLRSLVCSLYLQHIRAQTPMSKCPLATVASGCPFEDTALWVKLTLWVSGALPRLFFLEDVEDY